MQNWNIKKPKIAEINIVPYVDVMLVLLIIFMVTAPLITQGVAVELPKAHAMALEDTKDIPIVLSVDEHANLFLNIADEVSRPMQPDIIQAEVAAAILKNPERKVVVRGDRRVNYDVMVQAMVLLQHAGVPSVALETTS